MRTTFASIKESWSRMPVKPVRTSRDRTWDGLTVDSLELNGAMYFRASPLDHHLIIYCTDGSGVMHQERSGRKSKEFLAPGSCIILPSGEDCFWNGVAPAHIRLRIPTGVFLAAGAEVPGAKQSPELLSIFHTSDAFIGRFAQLFDAELCLQPHPAQPLIVDAALHAFCLHLVRRHCAERATCVKVKGGLAPRRLSMALDYMNSNFDEAITLKELAAIAGVSCFHFARMFKKSVGTTPMEYLERVRIEKAKELLSRGRGSVADISRLCGYADASYFARRFRAVMSVSPTEFARTRRTQWSISDRDASTSRASA